MTRPNEIRILILNDGEHKINTLYRLEKHWTLHFMLGPTLASKNVTISCNHPVSDRDVFHRTTFNYLEWQNDSANNGDKSDAYAQLQIRQAGSFQYFFSVDGKKSGSGYFIVDPTLTVGSDDRVLHVDSICMHTVLPKSLGPFSEWMGRLQVSVESGYNVIHLTPVQLLGVSNSSYSIAEQLVVNPTYSANRVGKIDWKEMGELVQSLKMEHGMLTVTDVVWNHTAKNSEWLKASPECSFNLSNSKHLRPAYVLDRALFYLTLDVAAGKYVDDGVPITITKEKHLCALEKVLADKVIPELKLWEFFQVDVKKIIAEFFSEAAKCSKKVETNIRESVVIIQDRDFRRFGSTISMKSALQQFYSDPEKISIDAAASNLEDTLKWLNKIKKETAEKDLKEAMKNVLSGIRYERLDENGPKLRIVSKDSPLITEYFYHPFEDVSVANDEKCVMDEPRKSCFIMALNGWVMGDDPMRNFAEYPSQTYWRRELVCWGDSVKLNYGKSPDDCPVLWDRMRKYTELTARVFHGIRIDNCHSTPIHVAEYMLDAARALDPDLYVFAELFTGSEGLDNVFVNRLGINSLIREGLSAWDSQELGRLVHRYGGEPVASFIQPHERPLVPCMAHALLYDVTHDNESVIVKRTPFDVLPSSALVCMASCAIGSNRGHDELVPHHIHVVNEKRLYASWHNNSDQKTSNKITKGSGLIHGKRILNLLHQTMSINGFNQIFVDQRDKDVVVVTRHNKATHQSYILVAHTAFSEYKPRFVDPLVIEGQIDGIAFEAKPLLRCGQESLKSFSQNPEYINGLTDFGYSFESDLPLSLSGCCSVEEDDANINAQKIIFTDFPPGSVVVFRVKLKSAIDRSAQKVRSIVNKFVNGEDPALKRIICSLDLCQLNRILFRCNEEEASDGLGIGAYNFMGWETLKYCGIQGIMSVMSVIRSDNDLGHPVCKNLREGNWLLEYIGSRLVKHSSTKELGDWLTQGLSVLGQLPRYLIPAYFDMFMRPVYLALLEQCWSLMPPFISKGTTFVRTLALGSASLCGVVNGAGLPLFEEGKTEFPTLAAGLPHFSSGIMRCWGRDTFIALRGLMIIPGRYSEARQMILAFASCVRHGLIPNLLGEGKICRYNCRDAFWWWLQCVQDICETCDSGYDILKAPVGRIYPTDDAGPVLPPETMQPLYDIIQDCLQRHVNGINFQERGAGPQIDANMSEEGFNVIAGIDFDTGFVFGGSKYNCGTWMDKMGESVKAKTRGIPATPRDGSAVELVGLCKSAVKWLHRANNSAKYPYDGVFITMKDGQTNKLSWHAWNEKIQDSFEAQFFVSLDDRSQYVHKRGMYKDSVGSSSPWCDYQLRPNFAVAMVVAPELFNVQHAWRALNLTKEKLLGPLGMKTLDPDDMMYRGDYDNGNDTEDSSVAKGFNYHQGPEWVWPVGYFLRALLIFANELGEETLKDTANFIRGYLSTHQIHVESSMWKGLPELTNRDGAWCRDSCEIQAWSNSTIIEVLFDLDKYKI